MPNNIFISYSHHDCVFEEKLSNILQNLKEIQLAVWDDRKIRTGNEWLPEIKAAIETSKIIVLILSDNFLNSNFIQNEELKLIFKNATARIFPVLYNDCNMEAFDWLKGIQVFKCHEKAFRQTSERIWGEKLAELAEELKTYLKVKPNITTGKVPPKHYFISSDLFNSIENKIEEQIKNQGQYLFVYAPSGFGKSTLFTTYVDKWEKNQNKEISIRWFDFSQPAQNEFSGDADIIILDNIDKILNKPGEQIREEKDDQQTMIRNILDEYQSWTTNSSLKIFLTNRHATCESLKSVLSDHLTPDNTIELKGFNDKDCRLFLQSSVKPEKLEDIPSHHLLHINALVDGCPMIWQIIIDYIAADKLPEIYEQVRVEYGQDIAGQSGLNEIFEKWLDNSILQKSPMTKQIAGILCNYSIIGISRNAIAYILDKDVAEINEAMIPLVNKGFLGKPLPQDIAWVPHDLLQKACKNNDCLNFVEIDSQYKKYLLTRLANKDLLSKDDFLSLLDAWVVGVRQTFLESFEGRNTHQKEFFNRYNQIYKEIETLLAEKKISIGKTALTSHFSKYVDRECYELIPIARVLCCLPVKNSSMGDIMWSVVENNDYRYKKKQETDKEVGSYARAECIKAALYQWSENPGSMEYGCDKLIERWEYINDNLQIGYDDNDREMELSAILGGLCFLKKPNHAFQIANSEMICHRFPDAVMTFLLSTLRDHGREVELIFRFFWEKTSNTHIKPFIEAYLVQQFPNLIPEAAFKGRHLFNPQRVYYFTLMSSNQEFLEWVFPVIEKAKELDNHWAEIYF